MKVKSNVGGKSKSSNAQKEGSVDYMSPEESIMSAMPKKVAEAAEAKAPRPQLTRAANPIQPTRLSLI